MIRLGLVFVVACQAASRPLTQAEASKPLEHELPARSTELDSRRGFGVLEAGHGDADVRAFALRFVNVLADENVGQLRQLLGKATWQPGLARTTPVEEFVRRFAMLDYQALRAPLGQGAFDAMQLRSQGAGTWDVRLPQVSTSEPLFTGRPVLRVVRDGDGLAITAYGED